MTSKLYRTLLAGATTALVLSGAGAANATPLNIYSSPSLAIPDYPNAGVSDIITASGSNLIIDNVKIDVYITHTFLGDLDINVEHGGKTVNLWTLNGCGAHGSLDVLFADGGTTTDCDEIEHYDNGEEVDPMLSGTGVGDQLPDFIGLAADGDWTLSIVDTGAYDTGTLWTWSVHVDGHEGSPSSSVPEPATMALFGFGLAGLGFMRRRRSS